MAAAFEQTAATKSLQYAAARKDVISQPPNNSIGLKNLIKLSNFNFSCRRGCQTHLNFSQLTKGKNITKISDLKAI